MATKYIQDKNGNYYADEDGNLLTVDVSGEGGGQMLYRHDITLYERDNDSFDIGITIINTSSVAIDTIESVKNSVGLGKTINATGTYNVNSREAVRSITFFDNYMTVDYGIDSEYSGDYTSVNFRINDTITEIGVAGGGSGSGTPLVETTYDELKALRDGGQLVAGQKYRITDYNCTTTQENTSSAMHQFDIIVEALSNNTLSENASAIQHGGSGDSGGGSPQFKPEVLADSEGNLVEGAVVPSYYIFEDVYEMNGTMEGYKSQDTFIAYTYMENNDGVVVPVIYKTDADGAINAPEEYDYPDREDTFFYEGTMEIDGVVYDKWRKITLTDDSEITWDSDGKVWALTNVVVTSGGSASDSYFANCKLSAWEIKYSLDNDKTRFWWADETNGKGVIYHMKDEYSNECTYDFKSIQFKRWATDDEIANDDKFYSSWDDTGNAFRWCYTFMANGYTNDTWVDASTIKPYRYMSDESGMPCVNNTIKTFIQMYDENEETNAKEGVQWLNNIVLYGSYEDNPVFSENYEYNYILCPFGNKFGTNNHSMTLGKTYSCNYNTFGDSCSTNTLGENSNYNTFGNLCGYNTFGSGCSNNTFGNNCYSNTFGNSCNYNTFGGNCSRNTFGKFCDHHTFGGDCDSNTFGNLCTTNIIDSGVDNAQPLPTTGDHAMRGVHIHYGVTGQFTVVRGAKYTQDVRTANDATITV